MNAPFLRRNRLLAGLFTAVLATGIVAGTAAPASAGNSHHHKIDYVSLGDSYAAGQGGGAYLDNCAHTKAAYPRAVDRLRGVKWIADGTCTEADTRDLLKWQIPDLKWKLKKAELVTITIGANDVVLNEEIVAACSEAAPTASTAPEEDECATLVKAAIKKVKERVLKALIRLDDLNHRVKVIVTGYPYLYHPSDDAFESRINAGVKALNSALHWAVKKAKHWDVSAKYVDVTKIFWGHGIDSPRPWIHATGPDAWHPNQKGHWAYSHVVVHKVKHIF
jgi:lysophospholipase L1-like esterase